MTGNALVALVVAVVVEETGSIVIVNGSETATANVTERTVTRIRTTAHHADAVVLLKEEGPLALGEKNVIGHEHPLQPMM